MVAFRPPLANDVGTSPSAVAVGLIDGDADPDIVVANTDGTVSVLIGKGDGSFESDATYDVGKGASAVALADLDGKDGLDIVVANKDDDKISILLNKGDGTFAAQATHTVGDQPVGLVFADLDGKDGIDLLVVNQGADSVSVLLGKGDGTFTNGTSVTSGDAPSAIVVGDFNEDTKLDLIIAGKTTKVMTGDGNGGFTAAGDLTTTGAPDSMAIGDFNDDTHLDLAYTSGGKLFVQLGDGKGAFGTATQITAPSGVSDVTVTKVDGDAHLDLVLTNAAGNVLAILTGNGDATFDPAVSFAAGTGPGSLGFGDFNDDGLVDLVATDPSTGKASVLLQDALPVIGKIDMPPEATITEAVDASAQNIPTIHGEFKVSDGDKGDTFTASIVSTELKVNGGALPAGVNLAALTAAGALLFDTGVISDGGEKVLEWRWDPTAVNFDFLAKGDILTIDFKFKVNDGHGDSEPADLIFKVEGTNDAPVIQGGDKLDLSVREGDKSVGQITAKDLDNGDTLTFSLSGGDDMDLFVIDAKTGALSFKAGPDFEHPADKGGDNVYDVIVQVTDGDATDTQTLTVTVRDVAGRHIVVESVGSGGGSNGDSDGFSLSNRHGAVPADPNPDPVSPNAHGGGEEDRIVGDDRANRLSGHGGDDHILGGDGDDTLAGGDGHDRLKGENGDDNLDGGDGDDTLIGGLGRNTLTGGEGADRFVFDSAIGNGKGQTSFSEITDFNVDHDLIVLDIAIFAGAGKAGPLSADAFALGTAAGDDTDRIIYDSVTGNLLYDADGKAGPAVAVVFATIDKGLALEADNFLIT